MFAPRNQEYEKYKSLKGGIYTLEGLIGAGKTTLGKSLETYLNGIGLKTKFFPEYVNKLLLDQYIGDMNKYAYSFQLFMLSKRIEIYKEAEIYSNNGGISIMDRSLIGDMTFAQLQKNNGNFTNEEWLTYLSIVKQEIQLTPTLCVFLNCSPSQCLDRIRNRGINSEINGYTLDYIETLQKNYETTINQCENVKILHLDWNNEEKIHNNLLNKQTITNILDKFLL